LNVGVVATVSVAVMPGSVSRIGLIHNVV
jgi:hypothetical protein